MADPIMQDDENLDELEAQLRASLIEVQRKKAERLAQEEAVRRAIIAKEAEGKRLAELSRPVSVVVRALAGGMVIVTSDWREDLTAYWRTVPGRAYRGAAENAIPLKEWMSHVETDLTKMPGVSIVYNPGVEELIKYELEAPSWLIEIKDKRLRLTPGPRYNSYLLSDIPGAEWQAYKNPNHKWFEAPLAEAWRVFTKLEKVDGVLWSDDAKAFVIQQLDMRAKIDTIGKAEDWDYDPKFVPPYTLRAFQRVGDAFAEATGGRALIAYDMGLGKTPMAIAYALHNDLRALVICPASAKPNWVRQILKFTGKECVVLQGAEPTNYDLAVMIAGKQQFTVMNYDILGRAQAYDKERIDEDGVKHVEHVNEFAWAKFINTAKFDLIIFDESHYIKNVDSNRSQAARSLEADRILHLTGTPVLNRPGELWPILTMLQPNTFPSYEGFLRQYTNDGKTAKNIEALRETLKTVMIRRRQSDVRKDLPAKQRITEYHELSPKARKLYIRVLDGVYEAIAEMSARGETDNRNVTNVLVQIMRLKQICAIDKSAHTADIATELVESHEGEPHNKVLIFTQFKPSCFGIANRLGHEALSFVTRGRSEFVTADLPERDRLVQQFQNDKDIKYLVVTERTAKESHDITAAGYVIFNDLFWTPASHEQAEGRAYMREIDPHGITSYYMLTDPEARAQNEPKFEIEQWVWELLRMKEDVINSTVESVEASRDESVAMALIQRMKDSMWMRR